MSNKFDRFGFELEFAIPRQKGELVYGWEFLAKNWAVECDGSANHNLYNSHQGFEFQSPQFSNLEEVKDELIKRLEFIKEHGRLTHCCGFHIHFSNGKINRERLSNYLAKRNKVWNPRKEYTGGFYQKEFSKYQNVRLVEDGHYEARIFNATTSLRAIYNYFKVLKNGLLNQGIQSSL